jgi:hypothetical protein
MQIKCPPSTHRDLLETREQRLIGFLTAGIEDAAGVQEGATPGTILAVARCGDSPVARALIALRPTLAAKGYRVLVVFAEEDAQVDQFIASGCDSGAMPDVRIVRNPRLRDAHEQLIVCGSGVWFGDSLRRDNNRRDLFEQVLAAAPETAHAAARAFDRLWARTEPYLRLAALASDSLAAALPVRTPGNAGPTDPALR